MKIGIVSIYPQREGENYQGGVAWYTRNLVHALAKNEKGGEVLVFANQFDGPESYYDCGKKVKIVRCWRKGWRFVGEIITAVKKEKLALVHLQQEFKLFGKAHTSPLFLLLLLKLKLFKIRTIVTVHGVISPEAITKEFIKENNSRLPVFLSKMIFSFIFKGIGKLADRVIVHEQIFKDFLAKDYGVDPLKISVVSLGIEDIKPKVSREEARKKLKIGKKRVILFFGYVTGYKSPELLLEAFADYSKIDRDALLIMAGGKHPSLQDNPRYLARYENLLRLSEKIDKDQILWYGYVPEGDVEKVIMASDLLVLPYTVTISASGPLSISLSYRKPFLVSEQIGGMFENKKVVFKNNKADLVKKLKDFFEKKIEISDFIINLRKKRLWGNIAKETIVIYSKISIS